MAKGGRYNDIGEVFGRARPASGFDSDLKTLVKLSQDSIVKKAAIAAPLHADGDLAAVVAELRKQGEVVIASLEPGLPNDAQLREQGCDRKLQKGEGGWAVVAL